MYGRGPGHDNGLVHELGWNAREVIPELDADVDGLWIHSSGEEVRMGHLLARVIAAQDRWARPLGDFNHRWLSALFRPIRPIRNLLNGVWLGHPLHAAATDIPIGTLLLVVVLDLIGQPAAADIALVATILFMLAAAVTGAADYTDTDGTARVRATTHSTLMVVALLVLLVSLGLRAGSPTDRTIPIGLGIVGFLIVVGGAYVGGDVVYLLGNMVSRHAWRGAGIEVDPPRHRRPDRPWCASRGDAGEGQGRHQRHRPRPRRAIPSSRCTPSAPTPAVRWPRGRSPTAASNARGTARASG